MYYYINVHLKLAWCWRNNPNMFRYVGAAYAKQREWDGWAHKSGLTHISLVCGTVYA